MTIPHAATLRKSAPRDILAAHGPAVASAILRAFDKGLRQTQIALPEAAGPIMVVYLQHHGYHVYAGIQDDGSYLLTISW